MIIRYTVLLITLIFLCIGVHTTHKLSEKLTPAGKEFEKRVFLPPPEITKRLVLGFDNIVADFLWLEVIQYYGGRIEKNKPMPDLYSLFDTITTLDPKFIFAYIFASYVLSDWNNKNNALLILKKGMEQNPDVWILPYQAGFVYYLYFKNHLKAAQYFEIASTKPGAPELPARLAAMLYTKVGEKEIAYNIWLHVYNTAVDKYIKERARRKLIKLKIEIDIESLNKLIEKYSIKKQNMSKITIEIINSFIHFFQKNRIKKSSTIFSNKYPSSLKELVELGILNKIPKDPFGREYKYDSKTGKVSSQGLPWE